MYTRASSVRSICTTTSSARNKVLPDPPIADRNCAYNVIEQNTNINLGNRNSWAKTAWLTSSISFDSKNCECIPKVYYQQHVAGDLLVPPDTNTNNKNILYQPINIKLSANSSECCCHHGIHNGRQSPREYLNGNYSPDKTLICKNIFCKNDKNGPCFCSNSKNQLNDDDYVEL